MLAFDRTRIQESIEKAVKTGYTVTAEGQPLVGDTSGGTFGVRPALASNSEIFYGVAFNQQLTLTALPMTETVVVDVLEAATVNLSRAAIYAGTIRATLNGVALTVNVAGEVPAAGEVTVSLTNGTATLQASGTLVISYRYAPTAVEIATVQGAIPPGGSAALTLDSTGVIRHGEIYTTEYDTTVDWSAANPTIKAVNGLFTIGGTGATVPNATVTQVPAAGGVGVGGGFLGIAF